MSASREHKQVTLEKEAKVSGIGLFTGENVTAVLRPAPEDTGIIFRRTDLPGQPLIPAKLDFVKDTPRCTLLASNSVYIYTVEHILSAISAYQIDNLFIDVNASELPAGDGSANLFVDLLKGVQRKIQKKDKRIVELKEPIHWSEKSTHIIALPSKEFRISYTMHYPHSSFLGSQFCSFPIQLDTYCNEIAPCRTFSLYEEIEPMLQKGLLKGATLENGVVIKGDKVMNPDGIRFKDEMARHKILDLVGDLSLMGIRICAHVISIRSGHYSNIAFAKKLYKLINQESS